MDLGSIQRLRRMQKAVIVPTLRVVIYPVTLGVTFQDRVRGTC
jgi:hypothetical protein